MSSYLEESFARWLKRSKHIPPPQREYRFHPERKWRFDFAWPERRFAVEIEGITPGQGRHQTIKGFLR